MKEKAVFKMLFPDISEVEMHDMLVFACNSEGMTWIGFGYLWERAHECDWLPDFQEVSQNGMMGAMAHDLINPQRFLDALYEFGVASGRIG